MNNAAGSPNSITIDSYDSNPLTNNNGVNAAVGFDNIPYVANFNGSNQYLSVASNSALQTGNVDFWVAFWFNCSRVASNPNVVQKCNETGLNGEWPIFILAQPRLYLLLKIVLDNFNKQLDL